MIRKLFDIFGIIILIICFFSLGYFSNDMYRQYNAERTVNGLHIMSANKTKALQISNDYDPYGHWVCVNINGMDPLDGLKTCMHEVSHEMFATECGDSIESFGRCLEVANNETK